MANAPEDLFDVVRTGAARYSVYVGDELQDGEHNAVEEAQERAMELAAGNPGVECYVRLSYEARILYKGSATEPEPVPEPSPEPTPEPEPTPTPEPEPAPSDLSVILTNNFSTLWEPGWGGDGQVSLATLDGDPALQIHVPAGTSGYATGRMWPYLESTPNFPYTVLESEFDFMVSAGYDFHPISQKLQFHRTDGQSNSYYGLRADGRLHVTKQEGSTNRTSAAYNVESVPGAPKIVPGQKHHLRFRTTMTPAHPCFEAWVDGVQVLESVTAHDASLPADEILDGVPFTSGLVDNTYGGSGTGNGGDMFIANYVIRGA